MLMNLTPAGKYVLAGIAILAGLAGAFAAGRYTVQAEVRTEIKEVVKDRVITVTLTKQVEVERVVVKREIVRESKPDGTATERITETSATDTKTEATESAGAAADTERRAESTSSAPLPNWRFGALVGADVSAISLLTPPALVYGAHAERRIAGPLWVGAWGLRPASGVVVGVSVGLEF